MLPRNERGSTVRDQSLRRDQAGLCMAIVPGVRDAVTESSADNCLPHQYPPENEGVQFAGYKILRFTDSVLPVVYSIQCTIKCTKHSTCVPYALPYCC